MKRVNALVIGVALLVSAPGLATAETYTRLASHQQAVDYVITRALSQRGVPFSYGGGDASGPSLGTGTRSADPTGSVAAVDPAGSLAGLAPGANIFASNPAASSPAASNPAASVAPAPAPNVVGFDASGLMVYAFAGVGIKLPRSSGQQYNAGQKVLPAQALPGDLLFYGPDGSQSVAMFVGNGQMVEVTDTVVQVSPVRTAGMTPYLTRIIA